MDTTFIIGFVFGIFFHVIIEYILRDIKSEPQKILAIEPFKKFIIWADIADWIVWKSCDENKNITNLELNCICWMLAKKLNLDTSNFKKRFYPTDPDIYYRYCSNGATKISFPLSRKSANGRRINGSLSSLPNPNRAKKIIDELLNEVQKIKPQYKIIEMTKKMGYCQPKNVGDYEPLSEYSFK